MRKEVKYEIIRDGITKPSDARSVNIFHNRSERESKHGVNARDVTGDGEFRFGWGSIAGGLGADVNFRRQVGSGTFAAGASVSSGLNLKNIALKGNLFLPFERTTIAANGVVKYNREEKRVYPEGSVAIDRYVSNGWGIGAKIEQTLIDDHRKQELSIYTRNTR